MKRFGRIMWVITAVLVVISVCLHFYNRKLRRDIETAKLQNAELAIANEKLRNGSGLRLGDPCDCAFDGQKIVTDDGPGYCLNGVALMEESYKSIKANPNFKYTICQDPRKREQVK